MGPEHDPDAEERFDARCLVIGAGAAGIATARALAGRDIDFEWVEQSDRSGGMWNGGPDSPVYDSLRTVSSRTLTEFPSLPMPVDWPDYPDHRQMRDYLDECARGTGCLGRIRWNTTVRAVVAVPGPGMPGNNGWAVTLESTDTETRYYENVIVATGHHHAPHLPDDLPADFAGTVLHSLDYRNPETFADRRVVIVGAGTSAAEIAVEAAAQASSVVISARHGLSVVPKYLFGRPLDRLRPQAASLLPRSVEESLFGTLMRVTQGDSAAGADGTSVSQDLADLIDDGTITVAPGISEVSGHDITFTDDSMTAADVLVLATGYDIDLPFLSPEMIDVSGNQLPLYQRVVAPQRPGLWFVGFVDTSYGAIPLFEHQAEWIGALLAGAAVLPSRTAMRTWCERDAEDTAKRFPDPTTHTLQVDHWRYIKTLRAERGRRPQRSRLARRAR
ncbi:MAG: NAD(P)-binding domain-containing protein [Candidatus Nanopelagicales bacterium]